MDRDQVFGESDDVDFHSYGPRVMRADVSARDSSPHWQGHNEDVWDGTAGSESLAEEETLEKLWGWTVEISTRVWEKLEPVLIEHIPAEDKNPFYVCGVVFLVCLLAMAGLRADSGHSKAPRTVIKEVTKVSKLPPITVPHVTLPDGRRVAYREQGVSKELARYTILVLHGFPSSRLAGIPGIKHSLLEEFGVRLIAYDRPGFGESDVHHRKSLRTSAEDMAHIADALGVKEKFWVIGYATGGIHAWAAAKYIPSRIEGVGLFAPGGNFYAPNMTKQESRQAWELLSFRRKLLYRVAHWAPSVLPLVCRRMFLANTDKIFSDYLVTIGKDQVMMQQKMFMKVILKDIEESLRQGDGGTIAHELAVQVRPWGFHLSDFRVRKKLPPSGLLNWFVGMWKKEEEEWEGFSAPIHIWHGTEDQVIPITMNEFAVRMVPQAVLHKLEGEGHFSYFWFCDKCHRSILLALFEEAKGVKVPTTEDAASVGLETFFQNV